MQTWDLVSVKSMLEVMLQKRGLVVHFCQNCFRSFGFLAENTLQV
jgi:hypothetical protein